MQCVWLPRYDSEIHSVAVELLASTKSSASLRSCWVVLQHYEAKQESQDCHDAT